VVALELGQGAVAPMAHVDVDDHHAAEAAGDGGDVGSGPAAPPGAELPGVGSGLLEGLPGNQAPFAGDAGGYHRPAVPGVGEGGVQWGHGWPP
jgi:hypothetical protein